MAFPGWLRSRLALRLSLIGLLQIAVIAVGFVTYTRLRLPDFAAREAAEDAFAAQILPLLTDPVALLGELEKSRETLEATVTVTNPSGEVLASTSPPDAPPCLRPRTLRPALDDRGAAGPGPQDEAADLRRVRARGPRCRIAFLRFPDGEYGRIEFRPDRPPRPPSPFAVPVIAFVLLVVGISSLVLARSIAAPLSRLKETAEAFGRGDLEARARVERKDELGAVARSFDEMAGRIRDLLRAERELVANVSHELRTPLARIRVALELAAEGDAETARESLREITDDLDELDQLIEGVLAAARLDAAVTPGLPPLTREAIDLRALLERAEARLHSAEPGRTLEVTIEDELPTLEGDPVLLRRVLDNLLDNARKYSEQAILLRAGRDGDQVLLEVVDRGVGIDALDRERVFEPFFRADRSRTRATGGHGLGLALARRIVEAHGGAIGLESTPGKGTRVTVRLPIERPAPHHPSSG